MTARSGRPDGRGPRAMARLRLPGFLFVPLAVAACQAPPPNPPAPAKIAVPSPPPATAPPPAAVASLPPASLIDTATRLAAAITQPSAACLAHSAADAPARETRVHRWTDAAGIVHYSDQPPPRAARDPRTIDVRGAPPVAVEASGYDTALPDQLQQRAVADALGVQRVMRDALGVAAPAGLKLRIVFVQSAEAYARLIGDPALADSAGAYSTAQRTIFVRLQPQDEVNFAILRHELTHALVHESIGNLPAPLNEGMAEYFGRYRVAGLGGSIDFGAGRQAVVAAAVAGDGSDALVDLFAREGREFYEVGTGADGREHRYQRAYALVAMLMRSGEGRAALAATLRAQREDPCTPVAIEHVLARRYPGGLARLAGDWAAFMRDPPAGVQSY